MASHRRRLAVVAVAAQLCRSQARGWQQGLLARPWVPQLQGESALAQRLLRRTLKLSVWLLAATARLAVSLTGRQKDPRRLRPPC